ncbi:MAG: quinolinate synthase NadA [Bacteroidota bacterium]
MNSNKEIVYKIEQLKKKKNAIILAHFYQIPEVQDIADYIGDSLGLARIAANTNADIILFAGVHFMAETAKILNPTKKVIIPDPEAGCSLADSCTPEALQKLKNKHTDAIVVSYINCSSGVKALSDIICTSSNAKKIIDSVSRDRKIIFVPDRNLGAYLIRETGREMILWDGSCIVHEVFTTERLLKFKSEHTDALLLAHPECKSPVLALADFVGSTNAMLDYSVKSTAKKFIVATETGILHQMRKASPDKEFIAAPADNECGCSNCSFMKMNTLEKVLLCLETENFEIKMDEKLRKQAEAPLLRMLELS